MGSVTETQRSSSLCRSCSLVTGCRWVDHAADGIPMGALPDVVVGGSLGDADGFVVEGHSAVQHLNGFRQLVAAGVIGTLGFAGSEVAVVAGSV